MQGWGLRRPRSPVVLLLRPAAAAEARHDDARRRPDSRRARVRNPTARSAFAATSVGGARRAPPRRVAGVAIVRPLRLASAWAGVRDSLWFVPGIGAVLGATLALVAVRVPNPDGDLAWLEAWLFGGGVEGARGVLSTIAGSLITVTGVVFSVTVVALQLASSQFSPRVLGGFVADRVNQVVLGVFIGTFTYTLLVLRTIHSEGADRETFVPQVGVTLALVLLLASIGALIVFIDHAARSVQASVILERETRRTLARMEAVFPARRAAAAPAGADRPVAAAGAAAAVAAGSAGYLQSVDADALGELARAHGLTMRTELLVGGFALPGTKLASVWPAAAVDDDVRAAVRGAFALGPERTPEQDVELGILALADIAVRALSPGINDPTTAMHAIDRLAELLAALAPRVAPTAERGADDRRGAHVVGRQTTFDRAAGLAFDQIRHYGVSNPAVARRLLGVLGELAGGTEGATRRVIAVQAEAIARAARREVADPVDAAAIERLAGRVLRAAAEGRPEGA